MTKKEIKFAARLNSFKVGAAAYWPGKAEITTTDLIERAASAGLKAVDLNYPDHFNSILSRDLKDVIENMGMILNGVAMRYYSTPQFKLGSFTHPDKVIRRKAIEETKRGIDELAALGGDLLILWMGQDGFDYSFQCNYKNIWNWTIEALIEVTDHNKDVRIAIEYKPNEPRAFSLMPDVATTLLALKEVNRVNTGVVLDFAHVLYADEMPAFAANLIDRHSQLLSIHLNDGYGKWDNGLMVGSVHPIQTIELLIELQRANYDGVFFFDTFPDYSGLDPVSETKANIRTVNNFLAIADDLKNNKALADAIALQDSTASMQIIQSVLTR